MRWNTVKKVCAFSAATVLAFSTIGSTLTYAEEETSQQTQTFATRQEALDWIATFDATKYEVVANIDEQTVSGVTAQPSEEDLADGTLDGYYVTTSQDENGNTVATYHITGGVSEVNVSDANALAIYYWFADIEPGDSVTYTIQFVNESGDEYINNGASHVNSTINTYDGNQEITSSNGRFSDNQITESLTSNGPSGLLGAAASWIAGQYGFTGVSWDESDDNYRFDLLTQANLLAYYNKVMGTAYTDIAQAWSAYFYTNCWKLSYGTSLDQINLTDSTPVSVEVTGSLSGPNTDDMFQNIRFGWTDTVSFICPDTTSYVATVNLTEKTTPVTPDDSETPDSSKKKTDNVETSTQTSIGAYAMMGVAAVSGMGVIAILNKKRKSSK